MNRLLASIALAFVGIFGSAALPAAADPVEPADDCHYGFSVGPRGWLDLDMACGSIQDTNEMVRGRSLLHRRSDGFRKYSFTTNQVHGGWDTSCNNLIITDTWDTDVWVWVEFTMVDNPDTLADGC